MQLFEFHFNPGIKEDLRFDSFCYEPENIYEKRLGGLYMVGELKNALPHNYNFLEKLARILKKEYYSKFQRASEAALKGALKEGNEFLSTQLSRENTDWLGNLNFAIISLRDFDLNFTKVGAIKIFLIRSSHVIDIGAKLDLQEIEPYPLKIFNNIVSGRLGENDIILAVTNGIFPVFKGLINEIAKITPFDEKKLKELLKTKEKETALLSGALFLINLDKDFRMGKKPKIIFQKELEKFSMQKALFPALNSLKKAAFSLKTVPSFLLSFIIAVEKKMKLPPLSKTEHVLKEEPESEKDQKVKIKIKIPVKVYKPEDPVLEQNPKITNLLKLNFKIPRFRIPAFKFPSFKIPAFKISQLKINQSFKKRLNLILLLSFLLIIGYFAGRMEDQQTLKESRLVLQSIQEKVNQAESILSLKEVNPQAQINANALFLKALEEITPLTKTSGNIKKEVLSLKGKIETNLKNLNNLENIENPEVIFEFGSQEFIPQKIISDGKNLYFFTPLAQNIYKINESNEGEIITTDQKIYAATLLSPESILFFSKPDKLLSFQEGRLNDTLTLLASHAEFNFVELASFRENIYFLDGDSGQVIKYPAPISEGKDNPKIWLSEEARDRDSMAVDGSVWILNENNSVSVYYQGSLQKTIVLNIFPKPENFTKIFTLLTLPYLYILEPSQNRILIFSKEGKIIKQFQSEEFDNLLDFSVSADEKTIWLLNGLKLYKISL